MARPRPDGRYSSNGSSGGRAGGAGAAVPGAASAGAAPAAGAAPVRRRREQRVRRLQARIRSTVPRCFSSAGLCCPRPDPALIWPARATALSIALSLFRTTRRPRLRGSRGARLLLLLAAARIARDAGQVAGQGGSLVLAGRIVRTQEARARFLEVLGAAMTSRAGVREKLRRAICRPRGSVRRPG